MFIIIVFWLGYLGRWNIFLSWPLYSFPYSRLSSYLLLRGMVDDLSFFYHLNSNLFFANLISLYFSISYKILQYLFIIIFWLGCDRPSGLLFSWLLCFFPYSRLSSFVSLSYFVLAVHMRECLGKYLWMSSPFPIAILNGTCFFYDSAKN